MYLRYRKWWRFTGLNDSGFEYRRPIIDFCSVALQVLQPATKRYTIDSQLFNTDNILAVTKYCQCFCSFMSPERNPVLPAVGAAHEEFIFSNLCSLLFITG